MAWLPRLVSMPAVGMSRLGGESALQDPPANGEAVAEGGIHRDKSLGSMLHMFQHPQPPALHSDKLRRDASMGWCALFGASKA